MLKVPSLVEIILFKGLGMRLGMVFLMPLPPAEPRISRVPTQFKFGLKFLSYLGTC